MTHVALTALINGIAVTALASAVASLILRISRNSWNAATREVVWWAVLLVSVVTPFLFAGDVRLRDSNPGPRVTEPRVNLAAIPVWEESYPSGSRSIVRSNETLVSSENPAAVAATASGPFFPIRIPANRWPSWIVGAWVALSLISLGRLVAGAILLHMRKSRSLAAPAHLVTQLQQCLERYGACKRSIRIAVSHEITSPIAAGPFKPAILIPVRLIDQLEEGELNQVCLHEVAHLVRRDDYWLLVQRVVEALFVFNPVVHWITRHIDLEREIACDDFVINAAGEARRYALCLTRLVEISGPARDTLSATAAVERRSHLEKRVDMLLNDDRKKATRVLRARLAAVAAALLVVTAAVGRGPEVLVLAEPLNSHVNQPLPSRLLPPALQAPVAVTPAPPVFNGRAARLDRKLQAPVVVTQAPQPANAVSPDPQAKAPISIRVLVTDRLDRIVSGLESHHFRIRQEGVEQTISGFSGSEKQGGVSVVVVFNANATQEAGAISRQVMDRFVAVSRATDEFALIRFGAAPELAADFTPSADVITNRLLPARSGSGLLLDGVRMAISQLRSAKNPNKAILIVSEGAGEGPAFTEEETRMIAAATDVPIYAISVGANLPIEPLVDDLARKTGGRHYVIHGAAELDEVPNAASRVAVAMRYLYVLTFQPENPRGEPSYRTVEVEVLPPFGILHLRSEHRAGYIAFSH